MGTEDQDMEGFFDDADAVEATAEEFTNDTDVEAVSVEEIKSTSVVPQTSGQLSGLGIDFSSLASLPGVVVGKTGIEVSRFPVERIKFAKGQRALISVLSDQVVVAKVHYDQDLGSFLCFNGACCDHELAKVKYVFPIVKYETDAKGKPVGKELKNMCWAVGQDTYDSLKDIEDLKGSLTQFDLLINCTDDQFQKISVQEAGPARWHRIKGAEQKVSEFWAENGKYMLKSVARKITPEEYAKAMSGTVTSGNDVDFDDVFNS